jgi:ABC-type Fe3+/spermidine/putrescine transport system ATPase subunit
MSYLEIRNLTKRFGTFTAVDNFNLNVEKGEMVALLGASGCGKTTILRMVAGFLEPTGGDILIDGEGREQNSFL